MGDMGIKWHFKYRPSTQIASLQRAFTLQFPRPLMLGVAGNSKGLFKALFKAFLHSRVYIYTEVQFTQSLTVAYVSYLK